MLVLAAHEERERSRLSVTDESGHIVEALGVWAAVIVDDGLSEVQPISQAAYRRFLQARV